MSENHSANKAGEAASASPKSAEFEQKRSSSRMSGRSDGNNANRASGSKAAMQAPIIEPQVVPVLDHEVIDAY